MVDGVHEVTGLEGSIAISCLAGTQAEVVEQVVDFEMSKAEMDLHSRAEGLLGLSPDFSPVEIWRGGDRRPVLLRQECQPPDLCGVHRFSPGG